MAKLLYKLEIFGSIEVITGLHIGGSDVELNIGGIDNEVAKHKGKPYIPGSSLSGKLRHLIAKNFGYEKLDNDRGWFALLFNGTGFIDPILPNKNNNIKGNEKGNKVNGINYASHRRLVIRDSYLKENQNISNDKMLEDKAENVINRSTGNAMPRHIERVVSGTVFELNMILDVYEHDKVEELCKVLNLGFNLLNNDYLGGSGSRGYGSVKIEVNKVEKVLFINDLIKRNEFAEYKFK